MRTRGPFTFPAILSFPLAALFALSSIGGIVLPAVYAREAPAWAAQGIGQDWVDLVLVAPWLVACAWLTLRGSRIFCLLLGGTLVYTLYSLVLYAFFVHFNALFLVYCGALGFAFYATVSLVAGLRATDVRSWFSSRTPARVTGAFTAMLGAAFSVLWLSEVVPAIAGGTIPRSLVETGLSTNPVQILDLGIVLPAFIAGGVSLMRHRPLGYVLAPLMLAFGVLMDIALAAMTVSMTARNVPAEGPPFGLFAAMALVTSGVLAWFIGGLRGGWHSAC